jgi:hypothetical protein
MTSSGVALTLLRPLATLLLSLHMCRGCQQPLAVHLHTPIGHGTLSYQHYPLPSSTCLVCISVTLQLQLRLSNLDDMTI